MDRSERSRACCQRRRAPPTEGPSRDGRDLGGAAGSVDAMDIPSMIMGAAIASVAWIGFYPFAELKRLRAREAAAEAGEGPGTVA